MESYSIYLESEREKYSLLSLARLAGAEITGVSGCGSGYYIQIDATAAQVDYINRNIYTDEIHNYTAAQAWAAWKAGRLTMGQLATWQQRHYCYMNSAGEVLQA